MKVLALIRSHFSQNSLFAKTDRHIVFVCGGHKKEETSLRSRFLHYAEKNLPHIRILLAEDAYKDLISGSQRFVNLAVFEDMLADISDCVVLFPESPGSFAELGFFAASDRIASKVLTVNPYKFQADESFLNLGPIATINAESRYQPTLHIDHEIPDFEFVRKRLARFNDVKRRSSFPYQSFGLYERIQKFFAIFEIIRLLRVIHSATLPYVLKEIFGGEVSNDDVKNLVSILVAARYILRTGDDQRYLIPSPEARDFLDIPCREDLLMESNTYLLRFYKELYAETLGEGLSEL